MSKKINFLFISKIAFFVGLVICLCSFIVPLSPAVSLFTGEYEKVYGNGYSFIFGRMIETKNISYKPPFPSAQGIIGFSLMVITVCLLILSVLYKGKNDTINKWFIFASALTAISYSILFLCMHDSVARILADSLIGGHSDSVTETISKNSTIQFGIWGISVPGFFGAFFILASLVFDGSLDKVRGKLGIL